MAVKRKSGRLKKAKPPFVFVEEKKAAIPRGKHIISVKKGIVLRIQGDEAVVDFVVRDGRKLVRRTYVNGGNSVKDYYRFKIAGMLFPGHVIEPVLARVSREALQEYGVSKGLQSAPEHSMLYSKPIPVSDEYLKFISSYYGTGVVQSRVKGQNIGLVNSALQLAAKMEKFGIFANKHRVNHALNTRTDQMVFFEIQRLDINRVRKAAEKLDPEKRKKLETYIERFLNAKY